VNKAELRVSEQNETEIGERENKYTMSQFLFCFFFFDKRNRIQGIRAEIDLTKRAKPESRDMPTKRNRNWRNRTQIDLIDDVSISIKVMRQIEWNLSKSQLPNVL